MIIRIGNATINVTDLSHLWDPNQKDNLWFVAAADKHGMKFYQTFQTEAEAWNFHADVYENWVSSSENNGRDELTSGVPR